MSHRVALPSFSDDPSPAAPAVSRFDVVRLHAGELVGAEAAAVRAAVEADPALGAALRELQAEDAAFRLVVPLPRFLNDHAERTRGPGSAVASWWQRLRLPAVAVSAAAAALLVVVIPRDGDTGGGTDAPVYDGLKGAARVGFFVKDGERVRVGHAGETLRPGDQIQFAVRDDEDRRAMVLLGVDGKGAVSVYAHEPLDALRSKGTAPAPGVRLLEQSLVLDDTTGAERFFVVYADTDLEALQAEAERAARRLVSGGVDLATADRLQLPDGYVQSSVHILKVR